MGDNALVVVDCETTGLDRDLGPTGVHGIRGRDVIDAPTFTDVLGDVLDRLSGRIVVAHNARFDCLFLEYELARAGIHKAPLPAICTMELAALIGIGGGRARLVDCCSDLGVNAYDEHTAEGDALACAAILAAFLGTANTIDHLIRGAVESADSWPRSDRRATCRKRSKAVAASEPSFLATLARSADVPLGGNALEVAPYLDVLDRALEDRRLSETEQEDLAATASALDLDVERVRALHVDYVSTLIALAFRDGVVTERERADLELVAAVLGVDGIDDAVHRVGRRPESDDSAAATGLAGQSVCFTGALLCEYQGELVTREFAQWLAEQAGLVVLPRVTKKLDLLVVADPDSLSGKARKAREYGVRIVAETAFWSMIGVEVS